MILAIEAKFEIKGQYTVTLEKHDDYVGDGHHYKVRYGQQLTKDMSYLSAVDEFKSCVRHAEECAGWHNE